MTILPPWVIRIFCEGCRGYRSVRAADVPWGPEGARFRGCGCRRGTESRRCRAGWEVSGCIRGTEWFPAGSEAVWLTSSRCFLSEQGFPLLPLSLVLSSVSPFRRRGPSRRTLGLTHVVLMGTVRGRAMSMVRGHSRLLHNTLLCLFAFPPQ